MLTKLEGIAKVARERPNEPFTSLMHLINEEMIIMCHREMEGQKAVGVDRVTKEQYGENLEQNVKDLIVRMKRYAYRPQPVRRVYIDKPGSDKKRPLGIPSYEDKLVQAALAKILNAIYEQEFLDSSFGFRPSRSCHDALGAVDKILERRPINYIVDADIRAFFDYVDHKWLIKFIQHRIKDPNIIRYITRFLKAGVIEAGIQYNTPEGTPQGGVFSPILANIYLHYVLDLWFERRVRKQCKGATFMVRYADDSVFYFENEEEAKWFYEALQERLKQFNLEIAEEKSNIIAFGRNAAREARDNNQGHRRPGTFDFLGFTHYYGKGRNGSYRVKRKTSRKKYKASLLRCKHWVRKFRHLPVDILMYKLNQKLTGYYRYYGVSDNGFMLGKFRHEIRKIVFKYLNRRSQKRSFDWYKFMLFLKRYPIALPKIYVNIFKLKTDIGYIV